MIATRHGPRAVAALSAAGLIALLSACAYQEPPPLNGPAYPSGGPAPSPYGEPVYETRGTVAPPPRYATNTGVVSSIEVIRGERSTISPGGAIIGAVVGGVLGNQIGEGRGRTAATVVGAAGGALAGNAIGQRADRPTDTYRVAIQYDGGGLQYIDVTNPGDLRTGDRVRVDGNQISRY